MSTKKDLVEAHTFSRRRLVTAFVSGAPGGREVEPTKPGRALGGGIALAVLLCAGGLIAGYFGNRPSSDWLQPGLVISDKGNQYVITESGSDPTLHRIPNYATALLLLGPGVEGTRVSEEVISKQDIGADIGIIGAPGIVPEEDQLIDGGWTACIGRDTGVRTSLQPTPGARHLTSGEAFVVRSRDDRGRTAYWLVGQSPGIATEAPAYRFALPGAAQQRNDVLDQLDLPTVDQALPVPQAWLNLFPPGTPLTDASIGVPRSDERPDYPGTELPRQARIGSLVTTGQGDTYLLTASGGVELTEFQRRVLLGLRPQAPVEVDTVPSTVGDLPRDWPTGAPVAVQDEYCALLSPRPDDAAVVWLASEPDDTASAAGVAPGDLDAVVMSYHGALMRFGSFGQVEGGNPFLIDGEGKAYPLVGETVPGQLGYGGHDTLIAPDSWLNLFGRGVELSVEAAKRPVQVPGGDAPPGAAAR